MKRSDLLYVMSLGRGMVPDASSLSDGRAPRRALADWERRAKGGPPPDAEAEARARGQLAGVPVGHAGAPADGYMGDLGGFQSRRRELSNRAESEALRRLANVGWTDAARAASIMARRANAAARDAVAAAAGNGGGVRDTPAPALRRPTVAPATHGYRMPSGYVPPATDGTLVTTGDGVSLMMGGKLVRIGSSKVLSVGPDGSLLLKTRTGSVDLGKPDKWGQFTGKAGRAGVLVRQGNAVCLRVGGMLVSLEDGSVRTAAVTPSTDRRGVVIHELPGRWRAGRNEGADE